MATKPGKIVRIQMLRGVYAPRTKAFIRNGKAIKIKGKVKRGSQ